MWDHWGSSAPPRVGVPESHAVISDNDANYDLLTMTPVFHTPDNTELPKTATIL